MDVSLDVHTNRFKGTQKLIYTNNSPDTLHKVFYHLYLNAFQPGSMMDVRSRTIVDPDPRVRDRIEHLTPDEIGYQHVRDLYQDGQSLKYSLQCTILEVTLDHPILPHSKTEFDMQFTGQVPIQIRRTGRDNREGIRYSMTQWYPKMAEYDYQGWHADPYIGREFYGVWGDFDVHITIDSSYTVAGTGYLMNPSKLAMVTRILQSRSHDPIHRLQPGTFTLPKYTILHGLPIPTIPMKRTRLPVDLRYISST